MSGEDHTIGSVYTDREVLSYQQLPSKSTKYEYRRYRTALVWGYLWKTKILTVKGVTCMLYLRTPQAQISCNRSGSLSGSVARMAGDLLQRPQTMSTPAHRRPAMSDSPPVQMALL